MSYVLETGSKYIGFAGRVGHPPNLSLPDFPHTLLPYNKAICLLDIFACFALDPRST